MAGSRMGVLRAVVWWLRQGRGSERRALRDFRLAGLVATGPDSVLILDPAGLHEQSWGTAAE
jgi:hypothetical protein